MKTKVNKLIKLAAAGLFLIALAINVKVTLEDPFVMFSEGAIAQATSSSSSGDSGTVKKNKKAELVEITKEETYRCSYFNVVLSTIVWTDCVRDVVIDSYYCCITGTIQDACLSNPKCP